MKIFHLSDLHIGKQLNGYSLKENQEKVLNQIVDYAAAQQPDAVLICGDIYDKTAPSGEAYTMFGNFLEALSGIKPEITVLIIAGNHDSPERLSYASAFLERHRIHLSVFPPRSQEEYLKKVILRDENGPVNFYLLPFLKPGYVRQLFLDNQPEGYESAIRAVLERETIDAGERNILLSHQFYAAGNKDPETCESEQAVIMAGGLDRVDASVLSDFDYIALGHLHGSQKVGKAFIRYCGTPYKYSVSEENHKKSVTVVNIGKKGDEPELEFLPLNGIQDVRREIGTLSEILKRASEEKRHDYVSVTLTDEEEPYRVRERLEEVFDHLLELRVDNERTRQKRLEEGETVPVLKPLEAFRQFFKAVRGEEMTMEEEQAMERIVQEAKEEEGL
ncbi:MAG TPA: exonuclease SbcCD subunit D [Lachnoclostridium sp.]|uniref:Nuclease SbcCD subunit D n=1 Tax=[Clostridium] celerecrescens 18A TaxID=1286362 RepID=A0A2M8Z0T2_9FIRM|nr:exonuclease SbcCD subunit D [Lacrimispora celerecrescens]PJJ27064.1 exodeoxyribonuclease I subunit D [[Clostridium] celerecrescens 18A]HBE86293.1 exonuclease SbcCD subunit D [Lachnoclostridium sp.]